MSAIRPAHPAGPAPAAAPDPAAEAPPGRPHLVVVTTRPLGTGDVAAPEGSVLVTRFWHPRDRRWSENYFESLEHAARLFVDESGWRLLQDQATDGPFAHEMIFEARRADFAQPSTDEILRDIGMTPEGVAKMLDRPA